MAAIDTGIPEKLKTIEVIIQVVRDEFHPAFNQEAFEAPEVPENKAVGERIMQVQGKDQDQKGQLKYAIIGDPPAPDFFEINADNGVITIKKDLRTDYAPYYIVSVMTVYQWHTYTNKMRFQKQ